MDKQIISFLDRYYICIDQFSIRKKTNQLEMYIYPKPEILIGMIDVMVERIVKIIIIYISIEDQATVLVQYGNSKRCIQIQEKKVYSDSHMKLLNKLALATIYENSQE